MCRLPLSIAIGLALVSACVVPAAPLRYDAKEDTAPVAVHSEPTAPGFLHIRLAAHEGSASLRVRGTRRGELIFSREGDLVRSSTGEMASGFRLRAMPGATGLELRERSYPGELFIRASVGAGLSVENHVDLEDYVAGVVPAELVLWSAEEAEIEAQAIAARTYALRSLARRRTSDQQAFLWDDTRDQVYRGHFQGGDSDAARRVAERLQRALQRSRGLILQDTDGDLYDVRYHASCGGFTTSPAAAFPFESVWYHAPVRCEPCAAIGAEESAWPVDDGRRRRVHWRWTVTREDLLRLAQVLDGVGAVKSFVSPQLDGHQRWQSVEVRGTNGDTRVSIEELRRVLGAGSLKSGHILQVWPGIGQHITNGVYFEGLGRGHGAGLCQIGSHEYAERGWTAERILRHYLPGVRIAALPAPRLALATH